MTLEIERKFLVHHLLWQQLDKPAGELYRQGYLCTDPNRTIRVRTTAASGFLTIKGLTEGIIRNEYEYAIPMADATALLDKLAIAELSKVRYKVHYKSHVWEVDEFLGPNKGLIVAEIELTDKDEVFELPNWVSAEVTNDDRYYNSSLTQKPFNTW